MPGGSLLELEGGLGDIEDADAAVGAGDGEAAALELDIGLRGFQQMRGELLALGDDLLGDHDDGAAAHGGRARAAVPMPNATASVSPWMNLICSGSMPSRSTRICV